MAFLHSVLRRLLGPICKERPLSTELSPELYVDLLLCGLHPSCKKRSTSSIITGDQTGINLSVYIFTLSDPPNIAIIVVHVVIAVYSSEPTRYVVIIITNQYVVIIDMPPWGGGVIIIALTAWGSEPIVVCIDVVHTVVVVQRGGRNCCGRDGGARSTGPGVSGASGGCLWVRVVSGLC